MRNCQECGTAVGETWEYCLRCGEALPPLPEPVTTGFGGFLGRLGIRRHTSADPRDDAYDAAVSESGLKTAARRFGAARVPLWLTVMVAGVLSVGLIAPLLLLGGSSGVTEARQAEAAALREVDRLGGELEQVRADLAAAQERADAAEGELAALTEEASESQGTLAQAQQQTVELREQLDEVNTELETQQETLQSRQHHVELLQECVAGMEVVVQFARSGLMDQAAQAEQVIFPTCEEARSLG